MENHIRKGLRSRILWFMLFTSPEIGKRTRKGQDIIYRIRNGLKRSICVWNTWKPEFEQFELKKLVSKLLSLYPVANILQYGVVD
jgi:hypothetical protein